MKQCSGLVLLAALLVSGCATQAQIQAQTMAENAQSAGAAGEACVRNVQASPAFAPLLQRFPSKPSDTTIEQLANTNKATEGEIKAIFLVHPEFQKCRQALMSQAALTHPGIPPILAAAYAKRDADLVELVQKKITWGEWTVRLKTSDAELGVELAAENQRINAGLQQSHEAELQRRQAAANALAAYARQQQIIDNMNRPITTNCSALGNTVNCTTH